MSYDIDAIKSANPIERIVGERIDLKQRGHRHEGLCPFHTEKTASFCVNDQKQTFNCYGCGEYGDVLDFIVKYEGVDFKTACQILGGEKQAPDDKNRKKRQKQAIKSIYDGIEPIVPVPDDAELISAGKRTPGIWNPNRDSYTVYKPSMVFEYRNADGMLIGYVLRIDFDDGVKITPSVMWCKRGDKFEWSHYTFPEPRTLYGLERLKHNPDSPVLIVEGEKCVDAARTLLPSYNTVTWSGGGNAVHRTDWLPLKRCKVLIWPDADQPGVDAAGYVAAKCMDAGVEQVRIIAWDKSKPKGWDIADALKEGWTKEKVIKWARDRVSIWPPVEPDESEPATDSLPPVDAYDMDLTAMSEEPIGLDDAPFKSLGYHNNVFYFLPDSTQQVLSLSLGQIGHASLLLLAPLNYWESRFTSKRGVHWDAAIGGVMNDACRAGVFDANNKLRGRGAWLDAGRSVLHLGTKVYFDGVPYEPRNAPTKYIYESLLDLDIDPKSPATTKEANQLAQICDRLTWDNPIFGALLTGWCVIAPVCGILSWRPHIWITGPSGCGKSTIMNEIVKKILGNMSISLEGSSTEAGTRSQLKHDALPVVYDEAEAEDAHSSARMQGILAFARIASSGGRIQKGTPDGKGMSFNVRSSFCFSSINTSVQHHADDTRITRLILKKDLAANSDEKYRALIEDILRTITPSYANAMLARALKHLHTLQANCATFVEAAARVFKNRRIADQLGTMLGGTYLCYSEKEISLAEATAWIEKHDWQDITTLNTQIDEMKLLDRIISHRVRVNTVNGVIDTSLGELALIASDNFTEEGISPTAANHELRLNGLMVEGDYIYIINKCEPLKKILNGTPWAADWSRPMRDIPSAVSTETKYFAPGINGRATKIPLDVFRG